MIQSNIALTLEFLKRQPDAAVRALEGHAAADVGEFLLEVPAEIATLALERMLPQFASGIINCLSAEQAVGLLGRLNPRRIAFILRRTSRPLADEILLILPEEKRKESKGQLKYPEDLVGAWMNAEAPAALRESPMSDVAVVMADLRFCKPIGRVYVVDAENKLQGELSMGALFSSPPDALVSSVMVKKTAWVESRATMESLRESPLWKGRDVLAVVDLNRRFLGVLRHADMRRCWDLNASKEVAEEGAELAPTLFEEYFRTLWIMFTSLVGEYTKSSKT